MRPHEPESGHPTFSLDEIPFSRYGSWLDISPVVGLHRFAEDLHLVTHQTGMHAILSLVPQVDGERVETVWEADPATLTWRHAEGQIDAAFETTDTVRLRGRGLALKVVAAEPALTPFSGPYFFRDPIDGSLVYTHYQSGRRYRITTLSGRLTVVGDQALGTAERGAVIEPADSGSWEIAVEEFETSRRPYVSGGSFALVEDAVRAEFTKFLADVAPWRTQRTPAADLAAYVLWSATVNPAGFLQRPSVLMSKHWMDKVWSWDHCFNAVALAGGRPELALDQFLTPFDHQDPRGALPDSVAHSERLYNFVKPPIHGWALRTLRRHLAQDLDVQALTDIYWKLAFWARFWLDARRAPDRELPHYQHGNDSGWDNATTFDPARVLETADLAGFLVQTLSTLAELATELGLVADSEEWSVLADAIQQAMIDHLWDGSGFGARNPNTGEITRCASLLNLLPITLGARLPAQIADRLADGIKVHLTEWGVSTEPPNSPHYEPDGYWRGPIWAPSTVLVENGLRRAGHVGLADDISDRFRRLCEKSGFAENFDALTGAGLRDRAYTWTASAYLILAAEHEDRMRLAVPDSAEVVA
ncbi:Glycogen debranching enzyme (alpha-1,6-glucosidase) [Nakamurella panacisegetis]|uniref:Glycogen debranching enzyme (Alpha-1,6-glucosidase) n=2 Tax=Nakamurella panacisegetis TaxID=1090615 RepID=A0A1H0RYJ1_9ACTN|nr:Glycogen debranching enzyme (alpha-1,6-glucosidase) [Nakamurella panacisegetis]